MPSTSQLNGLNTEPCIIYMYTYIHYAKVIYFKTLTRMASTETGGYRERVIVNGIFTCIGIIIRKYSKVLSKSTY